MGRRGTLLDTWMGLDKALHIWEERYPVGHTDGDRKSITLMERSVLQDTCVGLG